ncbi:MAG TPA: thioesterase family protein [Bacteroidota bacterium]|nr:thioesterase family protein [Bacteroidota bacterium]
MEGVGAVIRQLTEIRVRYADTDQMRFVYYAKYFEYFEQGRSDLLRQIGLPYSEIEHLGIWLPVIEAHAKYIRSARYDDLLVVETAMKEMPVARVRIEYKIFRNGEDEPIVEGFTVHGFLNATTGKPTRAPGVFLQAVEEAMRKSADVSVAARS